MTNLKRMWCAATGGLLIGLALMVAPRSLAAPPAGEDQVEREKQFVRMLTGTVMTGAFTVSDGDENAPLPKDRYTILKVEKGEGELWTITARVQYKARDMTVPVPIYVRWAGDTPMLQMTDMLIPGMGKYTARVLIYDGQYAGTWKAGDHGGQMFGTITRLDEAPAE